MKKKRDRRRRWRECYWCMADYKSLQIAYSENFEDCCSVMCGKCGACGPFEKTEIGAIRTWNHGPYLIPCPNCT